ncbi:MAG: class I SAM-dependent methyltransferase [Nitrospira sp.]|nr:class I SAM-dependent methyltransferase [Nitrospira sp.]
MRTSALYDKDRSVAFYEERYSDGSHYMEEWPIEKKRRVFDVIRSLRLPLEGEAVDYGCGNGIFTDVLRQALAPGWKVYGVDVSEAAVERAKTRYPECAFHLTNDPRLIGKTFDFVFTHHVLEHVYDVAQVLDEITERAKLHSTALHILPCGNAGSFEHSICLLRKDGINASLENRFFFEDEGHVRRLTSSELCRLCHDRGFVLTEEGYSNQYYGAIEWITQAGPRFIELLTETAQAISPKARGRLKAIRIRLMLYWWMRRAVLELESRLARVPKTWRNYVAMLLLTLPYLFSKPIDLYLHRNAIAEWKTRQTEPNGSEMYLSFTRGRGKASDASE